LLLLLFNVPLVGDVLVGGAAVLVLGAMLLTRFGTRRYRPSSLNGPDELSTLTMLN
jgi:hypothetical protein